MESKMNRTWTKDEEKNLIELWELNFEFFINGKKKSFFLRMQMNMDFDYIQIKNKIYKIRLKYLTLKKLNIINGWCFYTQLDRMFSKYPNILYCALASHRIKQVPKVDCKNEIYKYRLEYILN